MYTLVIDNAIVKFHQELPPDHWIATTPTTGHFVPLTVDNAASHGYLPVVRQPRPADTATTTWDQTVTNGNNNAVTQTVVTRLGVFFDRFADLIEAQGLDR